MKRAVFLDRDGVINRKAPEGEYVTRWEEMEILPGVPKAVSLLNEAGYSVIVVTNQRCVAKGLVTEAEINALHRRMCRELSTAGATIDAAYYCPHQNTPPCSCRKPAPGMLLSAARDHQIDLTESWMVGDSDIDIAAGKNAGCKTARLFTNGETIRNADIASNSLLNLIQKILQSDTAHHHAATRSMAVPFRDTE